MRQKITLTSVGFLAMVIVIALSSYRSVPESKSDTPVSPIPNRISDPYGAAPLGQTLGFIKDVYVLDGKPMLTYDEAEIYFGSDAKKAMARDGFCPERNAQGECEVLNEYYISNSSTTTVALKLSDQAEIELSGDCSVLTPVHITVKDFVQKFGDPNGCDAPGTTYDVPQTSSYWISKDTQGDVIKIVEQFVP